MNIFLGRERESFDMLSVHARFFLFGKNAKRGVPKGIFGSV
jgi:hypothetical protein